MSTASRQTIVDYVNSKLQGFLTLAQEKGLKLKKQEDKVAIENFIDDAVSDLKDLLVKEFPDVVVKAKKERVKKEKKPKDVNAPKRASTSFLHFCADKRDEVKVAFPEIKPKDISRRLGEMWKALSEEEKAPYKELYEADKARYTLAMSNYVPSEEAPVVEKKTRKPRKPKDSSAPKKAKNSYMLYSDAVRAQVKADNPTLASKEIVKLVADMWKGLSDEEKAPYKEQADEKKAEYEVAKAEYAKNVSSSDDEKEATVKEVKEKKPRAKNAFQNYCASVRARVKKDNPEAGFGEISTILAEEWNALADEEKAKFKVVAVSESVEEVPKKTKKVSKAKESKEEVVEESKEEVEEESKQEVVEEPEEQPKKKVIKAKVPKAKVVEESEEEVVEEPEEQPKKKVIKAKVAKVANK
jgi:hypothetical protein